MIENNSIVSTRVIELDNCNDNIIQALVDQGDIAALKQAVEACPALIDWKYKVFKLTKLFF